jgi:hypothetical protein
VLTVSVMQQIPPPPFFCFVLFLVCEAIGTAAPPGVLCQPRVIVKMIVEKETECRVAGETDVLGENLPQRHFCRSQNPTWPDPGLNPGRRGGMPATNRLSYGAALSRFPCFSLQQCRPISRRLFPGCRTAVGPTQPAGGCNIGSKAAEA